jgi:acyl carrier protein
VFLEIKNTKFVPNYSENKKILISYLVKKIGKKKYQLLSSSQNLLKTGIIDSLDLADIHSFIEKKFKKKINFIKIFGKKFNITLNNFFKCIK